MKTLFYKLKTQKLPVLISLILTGFWGFSGLYLPFTTDEAYYAGWTQNLSFGYFDHPPMVAYSAIFYRLIPYAFAARLGILLCALGTLYLVVKISSHLFQNDKKLITTALLLSSTTFLGLGMGMLLTPDTPFIFFWTLCLFFSVLAAHKNPRYWIFWGLSLGFGFLAKYTMVLMPMSLGFYALFYHRSLFKEKWLYAGLVGALLIFSTNFFWNYKHDFVSYRFQLRHGFALPKDSAPPSPLDLKKTASPTEKFLISQAQNHEAPPKIRPEPPTTLLSKIQASLKRLTDFIGSQFALMGFFSLILIATIMQSLRKRQAKFLMSFMAYPRSKLIFSFTLIPFAFFSVISLFAKIEPNWSAMGFIGLALLLAPVLAPKLNWLKVAALINVLIVILLIIHTRHAFLPLRSGQDRLSREVLGYQDGSQFTADLAQKYSANIFAETYQLTALLRHYIPGSLIYQWPGLTRPSQFTLDNKVTTQMIGANFLLAHNQFPPPLFSGFTLAELWRIEVCQGQTRIFTFDSHEEVAKCKKLLHRWYLSFYQNEVH